MDQSEVLRILEQHNAIIKGTHVVYTSGRHGSVYINKDAIYPHTAAVSNLCAAMAKAYSDASVEVVVGPVVGGVVLAQWVAFHLSTPSHEVLAVYAEKGQGFELRRGYDALVSGRRILVVEDVLTTGGSVAGVVAAVRKAGGEVIGIAAICNRGQVRLEDVGNPPSLHCLIDINLDSFEASECPLCKAGVPINTTVGKGAEFIARRG